ncbi:MAG: M28 family peptidase [Gemmatimonadota bacterium]
MMRSYGFAVLPLLMSGALVPAAARAQEQSLLPAPIVAALAEELSGEAAKRNLEFLTRLHRMPASPAFHEAILFLASQAKAAGLNDIHVDSFPTDGKRFYGTQRSRPAWYADFGELWEMERRPSGWVPAIRLASWDAMPITVADMGESGDVETELVDVGDGTAESDYVGKDVRGKLILTGGQPGAVAPLGLARLGAAGIVSYAQNQHQAWWGEDENLIRWGHFDAFTPFNTFGFMVSLKQARTFRHRLGRGEVIRLKASVRAARRPGFYEVLSATIPGGDPKLRDEEIAFSCHLDHQRPGANDNASGCVTIMEIARAVSKLIADGRLPRPARTLRFIWPPEIEGTFALLTSRPELARRFKAVVHMDMVGGGPVTKSIFRVHRGPASRPSFINDVAEVWGQLANDESLAFAGTGAARYPLVAPEGGKEPFQAKLDEFSLGSDHEIYAEGSFGIPAIYLAQWPDRYIHTNFDVAANIDPTVVKRAAFVGGASALVLANAGPNDAEALWGAIAAKSLRRTALMAERRAALDPTEAAALTRFHWQAERAMLPSLERFFPVPAALRSRADSFYAALETATGRPVAAPLPSGAGAIVYRRNPDLKGPMSGFAYDYLSDHYGAERSAALRLLGYSGLRGSGGDYAYETLNFVDGRRPLSEIRDAVSAVYGPIPLELVAEYLAALESIDVVKR